MVYGLLRGYARGASYRVELVHRDINRPVLPAVKHAG